MTLRSCASMAQPSLFVILPPYGPAQALRNGVPVGRSGTARILVELMFDFKPWAWVQRGLFALTITTLDDHRLPNDCDR